VAAEDAEELIRQTEAARGYLNPGHRYLAVEDPEFLRRYNELVGLALKHGDSEADTEGLPAKYRELVACVLLAFRGEAEDAIAGHLRRAMRLGATEKEAIGAFQAGFVPGGAPTLLTGMRVLAGIRKGDY
jgi:alkylhydroperoxidase/carboxymuconolactone decarboxylase family protein YurZ